MAQHTHTHTNGAGPEVCGGSRARLGAGASQREVKVGPASFHGAAAGARKSAAEIL